MADDKRLTVFVLFRKNAERQKLYDDKEWLNMISVRKRGFRFQSLKTNRNHIESYQH